MKVVSPIATGSGAYVLHEQIATKMHDYRLHPYSPWWSLAPYALSAFPLGRADVIHASSDYGCFLKRANKALVVTVHNYVSDPFMQQYSSGAQYIHNRIVLRHFTRKTLQLSDRVVVISRFMGEKLREDLAADIQVQTIYNGVDERSFAPQNRSISHDSTPVRILFCGNLKKRKCAHLLVPLANSLGKKFELYYTAGLANTSLTTEGLNASAASLIPVGRVTHSDMPELYNRMDILFMPSVREGFGLCVAEAMACGLPVVAADASALPELVVHGQGGYLHPIDDLQACVEAIVTIAENPKVARQMGQFNRARVEQLFTLARMVEEYRQLFEQLLSERSVQ